jgi:pyruvate-formate lyase-activating enzyme
MSRSERRASALFIEVAGLCNAKCPYCAQHQLRESQDRGSFMPPDLLRQVLDHLVRLGVVEPGALGSVALYNWGEPLLSPHLAEHLRDLRARGLQATLSSHFSRRLELDDDLWPVVRKLTFSLSGFSQETYGRIHGGSLGRALENFHAFLARVRRFAPAAEVVVSWHRYRHNEHEFWSAWRYFERLSVTFAPKVAHLGPVVELLALLRGALPAGRARDAERDLFLPHLRREVARSAAGARSFRCPAFDQVVVDEQGRLLLCCGVSNRDEGQVLGHVLELTAEELWRRKESNPLCTECIASGLAPFLYGAPDQALAWPAGGSWRDHLRLAVQDAPRALRGRALETIRTLPGGARLERALRARRKGGPARA